MIREDTGSNIDDVLKLGRMLVAHFEDHDTIGQWMAHHLAQLIVAAQDDAPTTVEQRIQIVETILKVWGKRRYYPAGAPLEEYADVLTALDLLGNTVHGSSLFRLFDRDTDMPDGESLRIAARSHCDRTRTPHA